MTNTQNLGVRLKGTTIKRVTAHNGQMVLDKCLGPGAIIRLVRSGDVIPKIVEVVRPATSGKPQLPDIPYEHKGADFYLKDIDSDDLVADKRVTDFFTTLKIDFVKLGTVSRLADAGLDSVIKIIKATPKDFLEVDGIQQRSAQKLYDAIQDKIKNPIHLAALMKASGSFGSGIGERRINEILKVYPNVLEEYPKIGEDYVFEKILRIPGFQKTTANVFVDGIPKYLKWFKESGLKTASLEETRVKATGASLKGQAVGFTGFRSKLAEERIQQNGGTITNGVTKETTILLVPNASFNSSKVEKARSKGIKILTSSEFERIYHVSFS